MALGARSIASTFVPDGFHSQLIVAQAGTVKFDFVPDTEIVPLLNCGHLRFRIICHHLADEPVARNFAALAEELFILGRIFCRRSRSPIRVGRLSIIHPPIPASIRNDLDRRNKHPQLCGKH